MLICMGEEERLIYMCTRPKGICPQQPEVPFRGGVHNARDNILVAASRILSNFVRQFLK